MLLKTLIAMPKLLFLATLLLSASAQAQQTIKIGANFGLTGSVARYGEWATRGINLALEEINGRGGVLGKNLEVEFEDSEGSTSKAVTAYHKLRNLDSIQFLLTYQSSIALALAPLANRDSVVQLFELRMI